MNARMEEDPMVKRNAGPTFQERRVLGAVARYGTVRAAAAALILSPHTIDAHLDHLRYKSGLHKIPQLIAWAAENGWLNDETATPNGRIRREDDDPAVQCRANRLSSEETSGNISIARSGQGRLTNR